MLKGLAAGFVQGCLTVGGGWWSVGGGFGVGWDVGWDNLKFCPGNGAWGRRPMIFFAGLD